MKFALFGLIFCFLTCNVFSSEKDDISYKDKHIAKFQFYDGPFLLPEWEKIKQIGIKYKCVDVYNKAIQYLKVADGSDRTNLYADLFDLFIGNPDFFLDLLFNEKSEKYADQVALGWIGEASNVNSEKLIIVLKSTQSSKRDSLLTLLKKYDKYKLLNKIDESESKNLCANKPKKECLECCAIITMGTFECEGSEVYSLVDGRKSLIKVSSSLSDYLCKNKLSHKSTLTPEECAKGCE